MNLPEIEMVGLQAAERFFQHKQREAAIAAMGAGFGHQKNFIAQAFKAGPHPDFGFAATVFPAIVEERNAAIDRLMDDFNCGFNVGHAAEMVATQAEGGNLRVVASELSEGNGSGGSLGHRESFDFAQQISVNLFF
jgi:hypothetical protein